MDGVFRYQGKKANQVSLFDNSIKPPKNFLFEWFSFVLFRQIKNRLNWFVGLDLGTIFPKNMFHSWHVIEQWDAALLNCKMDSKTSL